jgi:hypothetical protein
MNNTTSISSSLVIVLPIIILMIILLFIGIIANIINCIVFCQSKHRNNACSIFCAATSNVNIFILIQAIVGTMLDIILPINPKNSNLIYCKTSLYIRHGLIMINQSCTILSCTSCFALCKL